MKTLPCLTALTLSSFVVAVPTFGQSSEGTVRLRCEGLEQLDKRTYEIWEIDFAAQRLVISNFYATGSNRGEFGPITEEQGQVIAFGMPNNRLTRASVDRTSGYARVDFPLTESEKVKSGYPANEDVWMGYSLQCRVTEQLF